MKVGIEMNGRLIEFEVDEKPREHGQFSVEVFVDNKPRWNAWFADKEEKSLAP